jgi:MOSC domain-containing protein YiiM
VLTADLDLLGLPTGTLLDLGGPVVRLTGLRNPCAQINAFRPGLLKVVLSRADGTPTDEPAPSTASSEAATAAVIRKAGVMAVVERGGEVAPGQPITVSLPEPPHVPLAPV